MMKNLFLILILSVAFNFVNIFSQQEDSIDVMDTTIDSSIPELLALHDVIYPMWNEAYPNKDFKMFNHLLPLVHTSVEKIYSVQLPPLYSEKQGQWKNGVEALRNAEIKYNHAIEENDEDKLLEAAGELHTNYEYLVRIVTPVTKEIGEFHKMLFKIYNQYLPNDDYDRLNKAIDDLVPLADKLMNSSLPGWASDKKDDFTLYADELYLSTLDLRSLKNSNADLDKIGNGIERVHTNYQKLESLFE
jgi:hypothetical protein